MRKMVWTPTEIVELVLFFGACILLAACWAGFAFLVERLTGELSWKVKEQIAKIGYWATAIVVGFYFVKGFPASAAPVAPPSALPLPAAPLIPKLPEPVTLKGSHFVPMNR